MLLALCARLGYQIALIYTPREVCLTHLVQPSERFFPSLILEPPLSESPINHLAQDIGNAAPFISSDFGEGALLGWLKQDLNSLQLCHS